MNQLYAAAQPRSRAANSLSANRLDSSQMVQLLGLIRSTSPQQAKEQVQRLIRERGITQEEWDATARQASEICRALGIR